jgi:hypothetical protein
MFGTATRCWAKADAQSKKSASETLVTRTAKRSFITGFDGFQARPVGEVLGCDVSE